jgi:hypothetical protein
VLGRGNSLKWLERAFFRRKSPLHRSEHVLTHFLRQEKGRAQAAQIFSGKFDLVKRFSVTGSPKIELRWR